MQPVFMKANLVATAGWALLLAACGSAVEHPKPVYIAVAADGTVTIDGVAVPEGEDPMEAIRRRLGVPEESN